MSDGPYRGLPMPPEWRKVFRLAENPTCTSEELLAQIFVALEKIWRREVPSRVVACIRGVLDRPGLFGTEQMIRDLEDFRRVLPMGVMGNALFDHLRYIVDERKSGTMTLREAVTATLLDRVNCAGRQGEEYCLREIDHKKGKHACLRLMKVIQGGDLGVLADQLLDLGFKPTRRVQKHDGLDDGVRIL